MTSEQPHFAFFPFLADGHILPMVDMAKMLALRGVRTSIITTEMNVPIVSNSTKKILSSDVDLQIVQFKFPSEKFGLPEGIENVRSLTLMEEENLVPTVRLFFDNTPFLQEPIERLLIDLKPHCIVTDPFYFWFHDVAAKLNIPVFVLLGSGFFSMSISSSLQIHKPHEKVSSDSEPFLVPMPGNIMITRDQMLILDFDFPISLRMREAISKYEGVVLNTCRELEPVYAEYFMNTVGKRVWSIGPLALINRDAEEKMLRGAATLNEASSCMKWLNSKASNSTVFISFGSMTRLKDAQLKEIAMAMESCGFDFVWVVRKPEGDDSEKPWLPEGFEIRMEGKGLIIRDWAPQLAILEHESVGGFVTHCGWNSVLEGIISGKPMVTWPVAAEQFYNEKLLVDVLKIGVGVGCRKLNEFCGDEVMKEAIEKAVNQVMAGKQAEQMRERAIALRKLATVAVAENGSSYDDVADLIKQFGR